MKRNKLFLLKYYQLKTKFWSKILLIMSFFHYLIYNVCLVCIVYAIDHLFKISSLVWQDLFSWLSLLSFIFPKFKAYRFAISSKISLWIFKLVHRRVCPHFLFSTENWLNRNSKNGINIPPNLFLIVHVLFTTIFQGIQVIFNTNMRCPSSVRVLICINIISSSITNMLWCCFCAY